MFTLEAYQKAFSRFVLSGDATALRPMVADRPSAEQLSIYRNNVVIGLTEALAKTFPATFALVGEKFFNAAAKRFIENHPPRTPVLAWYGEGFSDFLGSLEGVGKHPYLPDVARLEWARNRANVAPGQAPLSPPEFERLIREGKTSTLALAPFAGLVSSDFPVGEIREFALGQRNDPPELKTGRRERLVVYRRGGRIRVDKISSSTFEILRALAEGGGLSGFAGTRDSADQGNTVAELGRLVANGAFCRAGIEAEAK